MTHNYQLDISEIDIVIVAFMPDFSVLACSCRRRRRRIKNLIFWHLNDGCSLAEEMRHHAFFVCYFSSAAAAFYVAFQVLE